MEEQLEIVKDTVPKPFVFVLMPFDETFNDVYKPAVSEFMSQKFD